MLVELKLEQYIETFEEEEMTSIELLCDIGDRADGETELTEALKEMGIKKMGHRQAIVGAVMGEVRDVGWGGMERGDFSTRVVYRVFTS